MIFFSFSFFPYKDVVPTGLCCHFDAGDTVAKEKSFFSFLEISHPSQQVALESRKDNFISNETLFRLTNIIFEFFLEPYKKPDFKKMQELD